MRVFLALSLTFLHIFSSAQNSTAPSGSGTSVSPYQIATLDNLYWLSQNPTEWASTKYFVQTANIDASATSSWFLESGSNYYGFPCIGGAQTIGNQKNAIFYGNYDGQGFKITNLYMRRPNDRIGLFGRIQTPATIKNLVIKDATVIISSSSSPYGVGILIGYAYGGTVDNVFIDAGSLTSNNVIGGFASAGPVVGWEDGLTVSNTSSSASVTTNAGFVGGFLGIKAGSTSSYTNCKATGNVISTGSSRVGGFLGQTDNSGTVNFNKCSASGNVSGVSLVGGFIGYIASTTSNYTNCYTFGNVTASSGSAGGFFGYSGSNSSTLTNCYSKGLVTGATSGGFGISGGTFTFNNCFWDTQTSGKSNAYQSSTPAGITGKTTSQMTSQGTYTNWDFTNIWSIIGGTNGGYPFLITNGSTLPVTWQSFKAEKQGAASLLKWSTASEQNTKDFEVQHSTNTLSWTPLGTVAAAGNSTTTRQYSFTHATPFKGNVYNYYRILQRDLDGQFSYSKIASLIYDEPGADVIVYPNPAIGWVTIYLAEAKQVKLVNAVGATVWTGSLTAGRNQLDVSRLAKGSYWVVTQNFKKQILIQ
jgi:hypothetical protein